MTYRKSIIWKLKLRFSEKRFSEYLPAKDNPANKEIQLITVSILDVYSSLVTYVTECLPHSGGIGSIHSPVDANLRHRQRSLYPLAYYSAGNRRF